MSRGRPVDPSLASQTPEIVWPLIGRCLSENADDAFREVYRRGLWEYVAAEACDAGVGGLLLRKTIEHRVDVPASAARQMRAYSEHVAAANAYKYEAVRKVLARLQMAKVPFMLLKGAALNATIYDAGLRPMTDVDVLIHTKDAATAHKVLCNAGCRPGADLVREDFYPRFYCEREYFTHTHPAVKIDLHVRPFHVLRYARTVPEQAMWNDCMQVEAAGITANVPGPESMLIHLAVHAACHGGTQLRWLHDIKRWIEKYGTQINVERVAEKCRRWQIALPVHQTLTQAKEVFGGSDLLDRAIEATRGFAGPLQRLALAGAPLAADTPVLHVACNALTAPGLRFRMGYLAAVLLPGPGHLAQVYPHRHFGWKVAAHAVRLARCVSRVAQPAEA